MVVPLPTNRNKPSNLYLDTRGVWAFAETKQEPLYGVRELGWQAHHLYMLSHEVIKEGSIVRHSNNTIGMVTQLFTKGEYEMEVLYTDTLFGGMKLVNAKKVIATSNPDLWNLREYYKAGGGPAEGLPDNVAKIDTTFIEAYVRERGKIDKVLLEYETYQDTIKYHKDIWKNFERLKLKPNGSVVIHKLKQSKEELIERALEVIKSESEKSGVRKYTCINGFGYSQFERNIAEGIVNLIHN